MRRALRAGLATDTRGLLVRQTRRRPAGLRHGKNVGACRKGGFQTEDLLRYFAAIKKPYGSGEAATSEGCLESNKDASGLKGCFPCTTLLPQPGFGRVGHLLWSRLRGDMGGLLMLESLNPGQLSFEKTSAISTPKGLGWPRNLRGEVSALCCPKSRPVDQSGCFWP